MDKAAMEREIARLEEMIKEKERENEQLQKQLSQRLINLMEIVKADMIRIFEEIIEEEKRNIAHLLTEEPKPGPSSGLRASVRSFSPDGKSDGSVSTVSPGSSIGGGSAGGVSIGGYTMPSDSDEESMRTRAIARANAQLYGNDDVVLDDNESEESDVIVVEEIVNIDDEWDE